MDQNAIIKLCKELGCCDACCLRYLGLKNPNAYENPQKYITKYQDTTVNIENVPNEPVPSPPAPNSNEASSNGSSPPSKRLRSDRCRTCLGLLQSDSWPAACDMVKEMLDRKQYECSTFACALSAPIATLLREKALALRLAQACQHYDPKTVCPLKEAWKWSFGSKLAEHIGKGLDSGAVSPLLITLNMEYPDDLQELEILKTLSAALFESRSKQKKRFTVEFTRRSVEQALETVTLEALQRLEGWEEGLRPVGSTVRCESVVCTHTPLYLGGRYIKLSRELPQTPWVVGGKRMMPSSVQEIIFEPIAALYQMSPEEAEHRLKFMSAGREDVDVRCLGDGRPFALEITDPRRALSETELQAVCEQISKGGQVLVKHIVPVTKEDLVLLKKGEETKAKTYDALCIKLSHSEDEHGAVANGDTPIVVTAEDIANINSYRNTPAGAAAKVLLEQKTPIRVLHRRPLLTRTRSILDLTAQLVPGHPQLFSVRVRTQAGTYVKEWAHGELRRTRPALAHALRARADILALDVAAVHLHWPPAPSDHVAQ